MAIAVEVPKLGNTVEECLIAKWRKHKGEAVSAGEVVAEIETDKATFEVTAPADGTLLETFFDEGALVPVYTNFFVIGEAGESAEAFRPQLAAPAGAVAATEPVPTETPAAALDHPVAGPVPAAPVGSFSPRARRFAEEHGFHPAAVAGSGPGGRVLEEDLRKLYYSSPRVSSAARKHIEEGMEIRGAGSGVAGMVLSSDLTPPAARISGIREKIARRMRESLSSTAQYTLHTSADAGGLLRVRARVKASTGVPDININDLVTFCAIQALLEVPEVNAEFIDGRIYRHPEIHIGFACDTPRGLVVPVVRDAHQLTAGELSLQMKELAEQAVKGTISVDDLSGATFTVSNMGGLGIESFTPLLNPPQVAILGVDAIQLKPVRRDGGIEFIDAIGLSLTLDHQVIDGAPGARFLKVVKEKIESVESLCTI
ncbi:MAG: dihydrolipoamide acetyltransferase family protein [Bryobacteraceae bacterium]|jgi:pyruvate dehydrogenase E2 component (dihydrolipoamide acetyltransferase)